MWTDVKFKLKTLKFITIRKNKKIKKHKRL
jgi:hypothetical protein